MTAGTLGTERRAPTNQPTGTTGPPYFDYRPKDADEAIVAATSTDNGRTWTYDGEALEENPGYCPSADTTDDGEGHPNVITVGDNTYMYTLPRAAGDEAGVGMIVHQFTPTEQNPLGDLPATESVGIDPDAFVPTGTASIPVTTTSSATIPLTSVGTPGSPEQLVSGSFIDLTQDPVGTAPTVIDCTVSTSPAELTGCATTTLTGTGTITVNAGDLIEQVIGFTTKSSDVGAVPSGPNTTIGTGGVSSLTVDPVQATVPADGYTANQFTNPVTGATFNSDAPMRLYVDGTAIYCTNANSNPTDHIEDCTAGAGNSSFNIASEWEPITSDPIIPATAYDPAAGDGMTSGLVAPDGIVGTLPSYPESNPSLVGSNPTFVMYTTKELDYYLAGITTNSGATAFGAGSFTVDSTPGTYISQDLPNATGPDTLYIGATPPSGDTTDSPTIIEMTCSTVAESTGTFSGCTVPSAYATWTYASSSYLGAPGAAITPGSTLQEIGEGSATSIAKLWKNNQDISVLRVAWTTNGVTFSSAGLANGGVISGENNCQGATPDAICTASADSADPSAPYDDINNPAQQTSPSNLNGYADNDTANGTGPSTGGTDAGGVPLATEMRWVGSAGSIIDNDGTYELFLSGAWAADGDSDAFNQIFYSTSKNGEYWTVPTPVLSTDYSFAASATQDAELASGQDDPLGISAYYSGRAYAPSVVQNPDGTLTMVFGGDRIPKSIAVAGSMLGSGANQYTIDAQDPALYRNILTVTLQPAIAPAIATTTSVASTVGSSTTVGDSVTYTATVASTSDGGPPTGTVSFATTGG